MSRQLVSCCWRRLRGAYCHFSPAFSTLTAVMETDWLSLSLSLAQLLSIGVHSSMWSNKCTTSATLCALRERANIRGRRLGQPLAGKCKCKQVMEAWFVQVNSEPVNPSLMCHDSRCWNQPTSWTSANAQTCPWTKLFPTIHLLPSSGQKEPPNGVNCVRLQILARSTGYLCCSFGP